MGKVYVLTFRNELNENIRLVRHELQAFRAGVRAVSEQVFTILVLAPIRFCCRVGDGQSPLCDSRMTDVYALQDCSPLFARGSIVSGYSKSITW